MGDHAFHFTRFEFRKNHPNTIVFIVSCTQMWKEVRIEYTGADVETTSSIPQSWLDDLKEKLNKDYGYGPFDKSKLNQTFKNRNSYIF